MLAAVGAATVEDLFAEVPEAVRLRRPLDLPAGLSEVELLAELRAAGGAHDAGERARQLPRRRHLRPLRAGDRRRDRRPLRVPDRLHALPAGAQPGRAAEHLRVPDGDLRAHRHGGRQRLDVRRGDGARRGLVPGRGADAARQDRRVGRRAPGVPRGAGDRVGGLRPAPGRRRPRAGGAHRRRGPAGRDRRRHGGRRRAAAELLRRARGRGRGGTPRPRGGRAARRRRRPGRARPARDAGRARRRRRRRRGAVVRQPDELRRPRPGLHGRERQADAPPARPPRRRDARPRRPPRLRAHAADARAAHPPREGDLEHLLQPRAQRARGAGASRLAREAGASRARRDLPAPRRLPARAAARACPA